MKYSLLSDTDVEKSCFITSFNFSPFHEETFRSSHSQIFFEIGALKNFAVF